MNANLYKIKTAIYDKCGLKITAYSAEIESSAYDACQFELNGLKIVSRSAKITPEKIGQFVTFWKRNGKGPIAPFSETDALDFYTVIVQFEYRLGQFVFPKSVLVEKGILSTAKKEGKRAFRVYPNWDIAPNKQAEKTQKWQLPYFYEITTTTDFNKVTELYSLN